MQRYNVLFLCTGNSARSIMAEAIMNKKGFPTFAAYSAGSHPKSAVHPAAFLQLEIAKLPVVGLRSKSWEKFAAPDAPKLNFVFTVCDTMPQMRFVLFGRGNPLPLIGGYRTPLLSRALLNKSRRLSVMLTSLSIEESACSCAFHFPDSITSQLGKKSTG
jgi:hypothetical protein